jgi:hypothetical protein
MARQKGIIKLKGTIGDITFYKTQDGHLAREKGGIDAGRIAKMILRFRELVRMGRSLVELGRQESF